MFAVGETLVKPLAIELSAPIPLLIENDVALAVVQERDAAAPFTTEIGAIESVQLGAAGGGGVTTTLVSQVVSPPGPLTVMVYVVLEVRFTLVEPDSTGETSPTF